MKVYISYSLNDSEQYVLTILAKRLKEQGYIISSGYSFQTNEFNSQLNNSNLFIGLITVNGISNYRVMQEWQMATSKKIPSLLLIENKVPISPQLKQNPNIVFFDKYRPDASIDLVRQKIESSKKTEELTENAWVIGGLALLALIGLLSSKK